MKSFFVVSIGGVSSTDVHDLVSNIVNSRVEHYKHFIRRGHAVCKKSDSFFLAREIFYRSTEDNLFIVGKSAGAILTWQTLRALDRYNIFKKINACLIDAHGAVFGDGRIGPYCKKKNLFHNGFDQYRVKIYNIYQWEGGFSGASYPDAQCNRRIIDATVDHSNIVQHVETEKMIREAFDDLLFGGTYG